MYERQESKVRLRMSRYGEQIEDNLFSYLLILPTLLFFVFLIWIPFFRGIWISFHSWGLGGNQGWVGLANWRFIFTWPVFYVSLKATAIFLFSTVIQLAFALAAALAMRHIDYFENLINALLLVPYTMPAVVVAAFVVYLADPTFGPLFGYLVQWGVLEQPIYWGTQGDLSLLLVTLVNGWTFWPFMFLIFVASLDSAPDEWYEAAHTYGASHFQTFWNVTLPHLKSAIVIATSIRLIWNISKVSQPLTITQGGPGYETSILGILLYRFAFNQQAFGRAYVIGLLMFLIALVSIVKFIRVFERQSEEGV